MYLFDTSLGDVFKPRSKAPAKPPPKAPQRPPRAGEVVADGHWRWCPAPTGRSLDCDLQLKVRFRSSFQEFLHEVENAYERWMAKQTAHMLVKNLQGVLKKYHDNMLDSKLRDNATVVIAAGLTYRKSNGTWHVVDSSLRLWRS